MIVDSVMFRRIAVCDDAVLAFPDGLIGLPGTRYVLLPHAESSPFLWLHSAEHPDVAVPVTRPWAFFPVYEVKLNVGYSRQLALEAPEQAVILCVVRAAEKLRDCTADLAAPVVVNTATRLGYQIINEAGGYSVRHPLLPEEQSRAVRARA